MSPAVANFVFEAANFLVLAAVLGWILFQPVRRLLDQERDRHLAEEAKAAKDRAEAERLVEEARQMRAGLDQELKTRRETVLIEAQHEAERIQAEARERQTAELARMRAQMESALESDTRALAPPLGRIAAESVRELLGTLDGPSLDLALAGVASRRLGELPEAARTEATVESARPLGPEVRRILAEVLGDAFRESVDEDLGAGVRVTTSAGQIDATASAIARRAADALVGALGTEQAAGS